MARTLPQVITILEVGNTGGGTAIPVSTNASVAINSDGSVALNITKNDSSVGFNLRNDYGDGYVYLLSGNRIGAIATTPILFSTPANRNYVEFRSIPANTRIRLTNNNFSTEQGLLPYGRFTAFSQIDIDVDGKPDCVIQWTGRFVTNNVTNPPFQAISIEKVVVAIDKDPRGFYRMSNIDVFTGSNESNPPDNIDRYTFHK